MNADDIYREIESIEGWFDKENVEGLMGISLPENPTIFECGTYKGRSTKATSLVWPDANIFTCDPVDEPGRQVPEGSRFFLMKGTDVEWNGLVPIDLLFLDDSHLYLDIKANFEKFVPFVKPGGYVVFHDYHFPTAAAVKEFVDELGGCTIDPRGEYGLAFWRKP